MRKRHWEQLSETVGFSVMPMETFSTFQDVLEANLKAHMDKINTICDVASKEYDIESSLDRMSEEWDTVSFETLSYKNTNTYVVKKWDEYQALLDDHVVLTQAMVFSPYKKYFEDQIMRWENKLLLTSDILEEWLMCQVQWMYLEPIFASDDIQKQLPSEHKRFLQVDGFWKKLLSRVRDSPNILTFCTGTRNLLKRLRESNQILEAVQKGLDSYLETKRQFFARFYFLSNDELLEILSQTKEPRAVQQHLRKCFENIHRLRFEDNDCMTEMHSAEGEVVPFTDGVFPRGNVEMWLSNVERMMRTSVADQIWKAYQALLTSERQEWVLQWPGQVVLVCSQIMWTISVTQALQSETPKENLAAYNNLMKEELIELTNVVRGDLTPLDRITLGAL
jgi:dynein heavy chain, axonemal